MTSRSLKTSSPTSTDEPFSLFSTFNSSPSQTASSDIDEHLALLNTNSLDFSLEEINPNLPDLNFDDEVEQSGQILLSNSSTDISSIDNTFSLPALFPSLDDLSMLDMKSLPSLSLSSSSSNISSLLALPHSDNETISSEDEEELSKTKKSTKTQRKTTTKRASTGKPSKRPQKKQKVNTDPNASTVDPNASAFIKSLAGLNSDELIAYQQQNQLTTTQEREMKSHIRKIKNRESALLSRQRRKSHQDVLQERIVFLKSEKVRLEREALQLEAQNVVLKSEFAEFQKMIQNNPIFTQIAQAAAASAASISSSSLSLPNSPPLATVQYAEPVAVSVPVSTVVKAEHLPQVSSTSNAMLQYGADITSDNKTETKVMSKTQENAFTFISLLLFIHSWNKIAPFYAKNVALQLDNRTVLETNTQDVQSY